MRGKLGAGGMGVVYRVFDRLLQREVALKTLKAQSARDLYRFKREFRALCDLVHPGLCTLLELHTTGDEWFFTMELVHGVTFIDWVRPSGGSDDPPSLDGDPAEADDDDTVPRSQVARSRGEILAATADVDRLERALYQLCDGVHALHVAGKLHRDLKPSNVLCERGGRVVLLDFGLVAEIELAGADHTHERAAVGTPAYMSPEQAADTPLTPASDWYAVGVMLYEALTGRRPFEGRADEIMRRKQLEAVPAPSTLAPSTPPHLDALCMRLLATDPRDRPDGAAVLAALGREPSTATSTIERTAGSSAPFVGRAAQLAALGQALVDSRDHGVAVFVRAASGMGKSALVAHFLARIADSALVLAGRCYEREALPYKTLDTLIDALTGALLRMEPAALAAVLPPDVAALARLFPVLRRVPQIAEPETRRFQPSDPQELRRRAWAALRELLAGLAARRPVVVCVDDLQWGDIDSASFLADLIARADRPPILLLLVHRAEDTDGPIVSFVNRRAAGGSIVPDLRVIDLPPLALDEATDLVRTLSGLPGDSDAWAQALIRDAGGNTLFLSELARSASTAGGAATLDELLRGRIAKLPDPARALLRACAVAARPMSVELAGRAAGVEDVSGALAVLRAERLVRAQAEQDRVEPYHDRIRATVVEDLATGELQAAHRELATAYRETSPDDREPLVDHLLGAGDTRGAAEHAFTAAIVAREALAFRSAADLYAIAVEFGDFDDDFRRELYVARAEALVNAGQLQEAAAMYQAAAALSAPEARGELERLRLEQILRAGMLREGVKLAERMLTEIGFPLPGGRRAALWSLAAQRVALRLSGLRFRERAAATIPADELRTVDVLWSICSGLSFADPILGKLVQLWHLRMALRLGEPRRVAMALAIEIGFVASAGAQHADRSMKVAARAREVADKVGDAYVRGLADACSGFGEFLVGRWREAEDYLEKGLRQMRDHVEGGRWEIDLTEIFQLGNLFYLGDVKSLVRLAPIYLREAEDRGDVYAQHGIRSWRSNVAWLAMGKPEDARAHVLGVALERGDVADFHLHDYYQLLANGQIDLYVGDGDGALARVERAWKDLDRALLLRIQTIRIEAGFLLGRAALASSRPDAIVIAQRAVAALAKEDVAWARALAALLTGGIELAVDQPERAIAALTTAEALCEQAAMPLHVQVARLARAEARGGAGIADRDAALAWMTEQTIADPLAFSRMLLPRERR